MKRPSQRRTRIAAALLLVGLTMVAAVYQLPPHFLFSDSGVTIGVTLWFLGFTLIGAGALSPFRRTLGGACAGFIVAAYLSVTRVENIGTNADETFANVAAELDATRAESLNPSDSASATPSTK